MGVRDSSWPGRLPQQQEFGEPCDHQAAKPVGCRAIVRNNVIFFSYHLALSSGRQMLLSWGIGSSNKEEQSPIPLKK